MWLKPYYPPDVVRTFSAITAEIERGLRHSGLSGNGFLKG
jgi:hypothetical protein